MLLVILGNLVMIFFCSFGVVDKIKSGFGVVGLVIDNYVNLLFNDFNFVFIYFLYFVVLFIYVVVLKNSCYVDEVCVFIYYLLSLKG